MWSNFRTDEHMCTAIPVSRDLLSETIMDYNYDCFREEKKNNVYKLPRLALV
jgi:hypothetical protein